MNPAPLLLALLLPVLATAAAAQVTNLPNTGCPTQGFPTPIGSPSLGQSFGTSYTAGRALVFSAVGLAIPPAPLPVPPACLPGCNVGVAPLLVFDSPQWSIVVPNDPGLLGTCLAAQHALLGLIGPPCIELSGAVQFCIQP